MPTKRPRRTLDGGTNSSTTPARISLTHLPIEVLAEILLYTRSPPTVLAVSRTCSFLYRSLALSADASFIWRGVRQTCNMPLPDLGEKWKGSEADLAAFVYGGGICEVCRKRTREMYVSFSARIRLCGSWHCRSKFLNEFLVSVGAELQGHDRRSLWVPPLEGARCFYPSRYDAPFWPRGEILLRKRDWETFQRDLQAWKDAEEAQAKGGADEQATRLLEQCHAAKQRLPRIMEVSQLLLAWKWDYDRVFKEIKKENETWRENLASSRGWDLEHLIATHTYESLQRRKNMLLEGIDMIDVSPILSTIESELLALRAHRQRQQAEATYREKLTGIKKIYDRLRCGTLGAVPTGSTGSTEPLVLPPLSVFCTLPSVRVLKGSPDPSALPPGLSSTPAASDIHSPLAVSLIRADVHGWLIPVQKHLMTLLGYPDGWQSANTRAVHPLKRVTARFFCRRCGEGNVGRRHQRELCLDFKGVCSHVCKGVKGRPHETNGGNGQDKGKSLTKKKSRDKTLDWTVEVFEKDEKVISFVKTILNLIDLAEDNPITSTVLNSFTIRCMTCKGWIDMDIDTAIGHVHRHESMEIEMLAGFLKEGVTVSIGDSYRSIPVSRLVFERGNTELLLGPSRRAKKLCKQVNYGCKHCLIFLETDTGISFENKGARAMSLHGLRSHVKEKHGIQDIRDEDFFCYTCIQSEGGERQGG